MSYFSVPFAQDLMLEFLIETQGLNNLYRRFCLRLVVREGAPQV